MGVDGQRHALDALSPGRDLVPFAQDAGWAPGLVWTDAENLAPSGFDHQSWEINVHIYAPVGLYTDTVLSTCGTRRGEFRPRQTRQLPRAVDLKGRFLSCQSY